DLGVVILRHAVKLPQYAKLPAVGAVDSVGSAPITIVGYGVRTDGGCVHFRCYPGDLGVRTMTTGTALSPGALSDSFMKVNATGSVCYFDNGAPFLTNDGTVLALTAWVQDWSCAGPSRGLRIDNQAMLSWIRGWIRSTS